MKHHKRYKYRLLPNIDQKILFDKTFCYSLHRRKDRQS